MAFEMKEKRANGEDKWFDAVESQAGAELSNVERDELSRVLYNKAFLQASYLVLMEANGKKEAVASANLTETTSLHEAIRMQSEFRGMVRVFLVLLELCQKEEKNV